jgi:hypothetical protein
METSDSQSWRAILKHITRPMGERQRLVKTLDIVPMTLNRWLNGESLPHKGHILRLLHVVNPSLREELMDALEIDFPEIRLLFENEGVEQLSSALFTELLNLRATTPRSLLFHRMSNAVLDKAILLLDPHRLGMAITIARCMPPTPAHNDKVYSLKEWPDAVLRRGSPILKRISFFWEQSRLGATPHRKGISRMFPISKRKPDGRHVVLNTR